MNVASFIASFLPPKLDDNLALRAYASDSVQNTNHPGMSIAMNRDRVLESWVMCAGRAYERYTIEHLLIGSTKFVPRSLLDPDNSLKSVSVPTVKHT